jgi:hypothetical protein
MVPLWDASQTSEGGDDWNNSGIIHNTKILHQSFENVKYLRYFWKQYEIKIS